MPGDRVKVAGRTIDVLSVDGRAITEVRIGPPAPEPASTNGDPEAIGSEPRLSRQ
jgi:hypothetical protein